jgi:polar amino acid transport system substrate-binding protein
MKIKNLLLLIVFALSISFSAIAQKTLSQIVKKGEIRVGMTGNQPPFSMKAKSGELIGYEVDLAAVLAENMGVELKLVEMPFANLLPALEKGEIDMVMSGMTITPERNLKAFFAGPYQLSGKSILTKSKVLAEIDEAEDVNSKQYKIACLKGSTSETFVKNFMPEVEIVAVENYDAGVDMVLTDAADGMVADYPICLISALRYQDKGLVTLDQPLTIEPIGAALPSGDPQFLNLLENYFNSLEVSGAIQILDKIWFEDSSWLLRVE